VNIEEWYATNIENWYLDIENDTFPTRFIPLTQKDAEVICTSYENGSVVPLDNESQTIVNHLCSKIDEEIANLNATESGVFIKLSCRSPKDVTVDSDQMKELYHEQISKIDHPTHNDIVIALFSSHIRALKVHHSREALDLFIKSERIFSDIQLALGDKEKFSINVIVRKWIDIELRHEFRGFVFNKTLNCLSQYYDFCYFPQLVEEIEEIVPNVQEFFRELKDKVKLDHYICDFGVVGDRVYIIELNPWLDTTDSCLYSWIKDLEILKNGPFQFRINTKPRGGIKGFVIQPWKKYFNK